VLCDGNSASYSLQVGASAYRVIDANSAGIGIRDVAFVGFSTGAASVYGTDVRMYRDAARTLALRNGTSNQTFRVYNTYTSSTNFERANLGWNGNVFLVGTEKGSAGGTARQLELQTDGTSKVAITTDGKVGIGTTAPSASLEVNAPSGYTGNLLDVQVDGSSKVNITHSGLIRVPSQVSAGSGANQTSIGSANSTGIYFSTNSYVGVQVSNASQYAFTSGGFNLGRDTYIGWSANIYPGYNTISEDLTLYRDAADTLAQRRTTNAQTYRLYNTYTSSTNFERANLGWSGNVFLVGTEKGSAGGTARQLELQTDGTSKVAITTDGKVGIGTTAPSASLEVNAPSGYTGNLLDLQVDGTSKFTVDENGNLINGSAGGGSPAINPFLLMGA
jgi:hypothetical protein